MIILIPIILFILFWVILILGLGTWALLKFFREIPNTIGFLTKLKK